MNNEIHGVRYNYHRSIASGLAIQTIVNFRDNRRIRSTGVLDIFRDRFNYAEKSRAEVGEEQAEKTSGGNDEGGG